MNRVPHGLNYLLIFLTIFFLGVAGFFAFQNYHLRAQLNELGIQGAGGGLPDAEIYDKDIPPETDCSEAEDDLCPQWCLPGSDYDCCLRAGEREWIPGRGCYSK